MKKYNFKIALNENAKEYITDILNSEEALEWVTDVNICYSIMKIGYSKYEITLYLTLSGIKDSSRMHNDFTFKTLFSDSCLYDAFKESEEEGNQYTNEIAEQIISLAFTQKELDIIIESLEDEEEE